MSRDRDPKSMQNNENEAPITRPVQPPSPVAWAARLWRPLVATVAVAAAFGITFVWPQRNGLEIDIDGSPRARAARNHEPYDLTQLAVLNNVIIHVKEHYVEPDRVVPKRMLLSGLNAIQRAVAPVLVHYDEGQPNLTVQVNNQRRRFRVDDVNSPWRLALRFREIFGFLQENLQDEDLDLREIEYSAINGMLHTLDPHTVLLTPSVYEEMRMSTRGEFGGLGIVISIRDGQLTIIRPMPGTPATRAGIRRGDRIVKINDESTLNMPLQEAVDRLRGPPGSRVSVWVVREGQGGWTAPRRFDLVRAVIHIESVESRMLDNGIGYIQIKSFQGNTFEDMQRALAQLHRQPMRGLVLDLRDNPGGLLEQAVRIADAFLSSGTIVTTSSNDPSQRDEKFATADGTEPNYPMVVLVNGGSASASEIVAGALKNHDRALIVGQRTFGKGSVQVLYDYPDGSALKLTIAQYLTPGDVSIQGVGIVPDIAIDPMTVDREDMDLMADQDYLRESDLRGHLNHARAREAVQPSILLRYYLPKEARERLREAGPEDLEENERENEFLTRFARDLLAHAQRAGRRELLADSEPVIGRAREGELGHAVAELRRLGVDWSAGTDQGSSAVDVQVTTNRPNNEARAGDDFQLRVSVRNRGDKPLFQLRATTKSDYRLFDGRELVFGRLNPGQTREWSTTLGACETKEQRRTCLLPRDIPDRSDSLRVEFQEAHGHAPTSAPVRTTIRSLPRPQFAYLLHVADNARGNGDGRVQRGELATMYLHVRNVGRGRTYETQANLRNASGAGVLLGDGRFRIDNMQPGEERVVAFTFEVLRDFEQQEAKLEVSIADTDLREIVTEKVIVPIAADAATVQARTGSVNVRPGATVREWPDARSKSVGRVLDRAVALPAQATIGNFVRVDMGGGHPGWIANADLVSSRSGAPGRVVRDLNHMPPRLELDYGQALVTRSNTLGLRGRATDDFRVRDMYIFVDARKVFYQSNRGAQNQREAAFHTQIPLHGGTNYVTVVVRENNEIASRRTIVIRRDAADGALMETPRFEDDEFGDMMGEEPLDD